MQPDLITLAVDTANTGVTTDKDYTRYEEYQNRSVYVGETHTPAARDTLTLYRTQPKASGNFKGTSKTAIKFSRDIAVAGVDGISTLTSPIIVEVSFSVPVGATPAATLLSRQTALALLDMDAVMAALNDQLMV